LKRSVLLAAALVFGFAPAAHADPRAKLFPLSSSGLPKSLKGAPAELTRVLARSLGAETTTVPIEDAAELMECSLTQNSCLEAIANSVGVTRILYGHVETGNGGVVVQLTSYEAGKGETAREITISGETADELATSLEDTLMKKAPVEEPPLVVTDPPPPLASTGGVTSGTWAMVIGGGAAVGVGVGLVLSANSLRTKVERAPTETSADIAFLIGLEKAGQQRMMIGGALVAVGGVVSTIGVIRMIAQKKSPKPEEPRFDVVPESGGASVRFSMGWR
jgi:hypothetical protein